MDPNSRLPTLLTQENFKVKFLNEYDSILLDLDGTMWNQDGITDIPNVAAAYNFLRAAGKRVFFMTNCAKLSRRKLCEKLWDIGVESGVRYVYTAGYVCAQYIKQRLDKRAKVYAMVDQGFKEEFEELGVSYIGYGKDSSNVIPKTISVKEIQKIYMDPDVRAVVAGLDPWFCVTKLFKAASHLQNKKCLFLTTDAGTGVEIAAGYVLPAAGAIANSVKSAANREAPIIMGKPNVHLFDLIKQEHLGVNPSRTIVIGDKLTTDIKFAKANRLSSVLVMTGNTKRETLDDLLDTILRKRLTIPEQKALRSRFQCCNKVTGSPAAKCQCVPTFLLPSFGDFGIWGAPPASEEETCQCYVPQPPCHDVC